MTGFLDGVIQFLKDLRADAASAAFSASDWLKRLGEKIDALGVPVFAAAAGGQTVSLGRFHEAAALADEVAAELSAVGAGPDPAGGPIAGLIVAELVKALLKAIKGRLGL